MDAHPIRWDDLPLFLAVARAGSLSGAARVLRVNHSTVFRRLQEMERTLQVRLFERVQGGYTLTPSGEEMLARAERVENEVTALTLSLGGRDVRLGGSIRITTVDSIAERIAPAHLAAFAERYPEIELEVAVDSAALDISRREADVAIRITGRPPEHLVGRKICEVAMGIYGARGLVRRRGFDEQQARWISSDLRLSPAARWLEKARPGARVVYSASTILGMVAATVAGIGLAPLPCHVADLEPRLLRLGPPIFDPGLGLWLLTHRDLRRTARIGLFLEFMADALARQKDLFEGATGRAALPRGAEPSTSKPRHGRLRNRR